MRVGLFFNFGLAFESRKYEKEPGAFTDWVESKKLRSLV
jgi:hypothetical protein